MNRIRLAFEGTFQADVSTVNNDVRHYDNATFQASYQEFQNDTTGVEIRLSTFGFQGDIEKSGFTVGTLIGSIGPYLSGEPTSFVRGRRFTPASGFTSWAGMTWFTGSLDEAAKTLFLDLSNALQIQNAAGDPVDIGDITVGALKQDSVHENTPVTAENFEPFAKIPYREDCWLQLTIVCRGRAIRRARRSILW